MWVSASFEYEHVMERYSLGTFVLPYIQSLYYCVHVSLLPSIVLMCCNTSHWCFLGNVSSRFAARGLSELLFRLSIWSLLCVGCLKYGD